MSSQRRNLVRKFTRLSLRLCLDELEDIIRIEINRRKRVWTRNWLLKRNTLGASNNIIRELALEDPREYYAALRMSENNFHQLLNRITHHVQRRDTVMREAIPAKMKLEAVISFLVTGSTQRFLQHFYRISKTTISDMIPEVCDAIYNALKEYIEVSKVM